MKEYGLLVSHYFTKLLWVQRSTAPDCIFCPMEHTLRSHGSPEQLSEVCFCFDTQSPGAITT